MSLYDIMHLLPVKLPLEQTPQTHPVDLLQLNK
jgi:hypothetical protein